MAGLFFGAKVKNVIGLGEVSAAGLPGEVGVVVLDVPEQSEAARSGLRQGDVILRCGGKQVDTLEDLVRACRDIPAGRKARLEVFRNQQPIRLKVPAAEPR